MYESPSPSSTCVAYQLVLAIPKSASNFKNFLSEYNILDVVEGATFLNSAFFKKGSLFAC